MTGFGGAPSTTFICGPADSGPCPSCGRTTTSDYTRARSCLPMDGGCGWSDYFPDCPVTPHEERDCPAPAAGTDHDPDHEREEGA